MTVIIPASHVQVVFNWTVPAFFSGRGATVLGFEVGGGETATLGEVAVNVEDAWDGTIRTITDNNITLDTIVVNTSTDSATLIVGVAGGLAVDGPPPNVSTLVRYQTPVRGRRGRGRSYWPGLISAPSIAENGLMTAPAAEDIQDQVNAFFAELDAGGANLTQVILQHTTPTGPDAPANPTPPLDPPPEVTSRLVDRRLATQRRRIRG